MDSPNNTDTNTLDRDNWSNYLLVKDEKGNLGYLKGNKDNTSMGMDRSSDLISGGKQAPQDASFMSVQNLTKSSQDKSELIFHPDDKQELDSFAQNMPTDDSKKYSIEKIVSRIIEKQNLDFDDKNKKIFTNILYNFFRSRKSAVIVRDLLNNSVLSKNKKLAPELIDTILSVVKSIKSKIDDSGGLVVNQAEIQVQTEVKKLEEDVNKEETNMSAQDEISQMLKMPGEDKKEEDKPAEKPQEKIEIKSEPVKEEVKVEIPKVEDKKPSEGFSIPSDGKVTKKEQPKITVTKTEDDKPDSSLPKVSRPGTIVTPKKAMADVVKPVKEEVQPEPAMRNPLTGPVQELQSYDLVGFRRLGETAEERTQKILDKINLLEQESYTKKAQGIAAWRNSPTYKMYLQMGADSMTDGKNVEDYINSNQGKEILTINEFSAISDLNKQLRF